MKVGKRTIWLALLIPFLIAGGVMFGNIVHYGVNTPFWDEWEMVPLFQKADHHVLGFSDLWQQHNEHRILFPNIVLTAAGYVTHWNVKAELLINFAFAAVTALMLYLFVLNKINRRSLAILTAILSAAWFFSPVQYENWLWGWQVEWFMCITGIVATIYLLDNFGGSDSKRRNLLFGGAIFTAIFATFSLGSGMLVWPVGLAILALYKQSGKVMGIWLAGFVLSAAAYYHHYKKPAASPSATIFLHQHLNFVKYILGYLGRPISGEPDVAINFGIILLAVPIPVLYFVWQKRASINKFVPWLALIAVSLMASVLTAVSRLGLGLDQSFASRYTAFSLLYIIGLTGLICTLLDTIKMSRRLISLVAVLVIVISTPLLTSSYKNGQTGIKSRGAYFQVLKYCTHQPSPSRECLISTYPDNSIAKSRLDYLKDKHWAGY